MRPILDPLYRACGWLAGLFMIALLITILLSIFGRLAGFYLRGLDAYAGYCMGASSFLALGYAFGHGDHIRVTLVIQRLTGTTRRGFELFCLLLALAMSGAFAFYSCKMVWWSYKFHDISQSNDATPLWIPQLGMAIGTAVFALSILDELILVLRGKALEAQAAELARTE
ncbi:MAG TPA: TRAP transporter small permease [Ferrovibrio sp.]|uniref:TRAP transporter small permease n=1 Tax=Ferrovibrio sp. TaxID=1917215 RepID=UPI002ED1429D